MSLSEVFLAAAAILSAVGALGAVFYKRRQPELDQATAAHQLVSSDAVKTEIERSSRALNAARDLRVLDLENWADEMRPWVYGVRTRDDMMCDLIKKAYEKLQMPIPDIPELPDTPKFPEPRPVLKP